MAFATKNGLTAADLKIFSIGFVIDYCNICADIKSGENVHEDEEKYYKLKGILEFVEEDYSNGEMTDEEYDEFMNNYMRLDDIYGEQ